MRQEHHVLERQQVGGNPGFLPVDVEPRGQEPAGPLAILEEDEVFTES